MATRSFLIVDTGSPIGTMNDLLTPTNYTKRVFLDKVASYFRGLAGGNRPTQNISYGSVTTSGDAVAASKNGTFTGLPSASETISVGGQAFTFINTLALLAVQDLTYTAATGGTAGNSITIANIDPGSGTHALSIGVTGSAISVNLASTAAVAATASLATTTPVVLTSVAAGTARNTQTFKTVVNAAAANPTNTILAAFTGTSAAIVCTITPNDGTNNSATPVNLTTANLVQLITTGAVTGKTVTITDASSFRILQTATGGDTTNMANGGEGDNVTATFSGGVAYAVTSTATQVKAAVDASTPAHALVSVAITGTGSTVQTAASATPLASGANVGANQVARDTVGLTAALIAGATATAINASTNANITGAVVASNPSSGVITITALMPGVGGNLYTLADAASNFTWASAATALSGGTGAFPVLNKVQV